MSPHSRTCAAVVGNFLVHHLTDPHRAVREFHRMLSGGGRVALTAWDLPGDDRLVGVLLDAIAEAGVGVPAGLPEAPSFFRFSADGALADLLRECGFTDVVTERIAFEHAVAGADEWWQVLLQGTVRMSALVTGQSVADQRRIRTEASPPEFLAEYDDVRRDGIGGEEGAAGDGRDAQDVEELRGH